MATVTCAPTSPFAVKSACNVTIAEADPNDLTAFDADATPTSPEFRYYILGDAPSGDDLRSHEFNVSADGDHVWMNVVFPVAGSWTLRLRDASDDSDVATVAVTVQ
jgi:hypothetical protein